MAGQGGIDAAAAVAGPKNLSDGFERACEKLLHCFTNSKMGVISVRGFDGVGRWSIAKYAARKSKESHLFDVQILVQLLGEDFSLRKAQMEIAHQLKMPTSMDDDGDDEDSIDTQVAAEIYKSLIGHKFLLVLGDVTKEINFKLIGDPNLRKGLIKDSKIVLVGPMDLKSDMAIQLEDLSMDMLHEEAADISRSPSVRGRFTGDTVLECFFYMLLFYYKDLTVDRLTLYWRGEGIIITREGEEEDVMIFDKVEALFTELQVRSMVNRRGNEVRVADSIADKAKALVTSSKRRAATHGRFWIENDSLPREVDDVEDIRIERMAIKDIRKLSSLPPKCSKLSTLILGVGYVGNTTFTISDKFLEQIQDLRLLDLDRLANTFLQISASCCHNLRVFSLTNCRHLQSLLSSFQILDQLEFLELSGAYDSSPSIPVDVFQHMNNLRHLWLINFKHLIGIPDEFFGHLWQLRILNLHGNDKLESLPSSLSKLVNLKQLILRDCSSLKMGLLPHLKNLSALEILDLGGCCSLEDLEDSVSPSLGDILPNLRTLDISNVKAIRRLSLKGCQSLESVWLYGLASLEVLDISGTKLKTLPQGMSSARLIRRLDMLHMNQISKIDWDDITDELEELNFSQCGTCNSSNDNEQQGEKGGARIRVSNSKLLQYFSPSSKLWDSKCFSRFHIYISPCQKDKQGTGNYIHLQRRLSVYKDIDSMIQTYNLTGRGSHFERCLEIQGGHRSPNGMHGVLSRVELLTLCDNAFVQRLSDLGDVDKMKEMKECRVKRCKQMEMFFVGDNASSDCLSRLEKIRMSELAILTSVFEGTYGSRSFAVLKHIHLECCPRLVTVFSSSIFLQSLEMIEIKYCSRLESVFGGDAAAKGSLKRLHTVCLWELRRLESICHGTYLPGLKKLKVRGCWMLKKLPLQFGDKDAASNSTSGGRVEVEGESTWWDCLKWEDERIKHLINFKDRRPFAQRR